MMSKFVKAMPLEGPSVILIQSAKQMLREMAKIGVYPKHKAFPKWEDMRDAYGMTWQLMVDGTPHWVVGISSSIENPIDTVAVLVHEATHVKQGYMEWISEASPSAEFEAYTMQALTATLLSQYRAKTRGA